MNKQLFRGPTFAAALIAASVAAFPAMAEPAAPPTPNGELEAFLQSVEENARQLSRVALAPRPYLGVATEPVDAEMHETLGLPRGVGLLVRQAPEDGPAAAAGVREGDVLHKIDGQLVVNLPQLMTLVRMNDKGDTVRLEIVRDGEPMTLEATLDERDLPDVPDVAGTSQFFRVRGQPGRAMIVPAPGDGRLYLGDDYELRLNPPEARELGLFKELDPDAMTELQRNIEWLVRDATEDAEKAAANAREAEQNRRAIDGFREGEAADGVDAMSDRLREMDAMLNQLRQQLDTNRLELESIRPQLMLQNGPTEGMNVMLSDGAGTARLTVEDGRARVRLTEGEDVVYDGPWPTAERQETLSRTNRERLEQLKRYVPENVRNAKPDEERRELKDDDGAVGITI